MDQVEREVWEGQGVSEVSMIILLEALIQSQEMKNMNNIRGILLCTDQAGALSMDL